MPPGDMSQRSDRGEFIGFVHGGWGWNDVKHNLKGHDRVKGEKKHGKEGRRHKGPEGIWARNVDSKQTSLLSRCEALHVSGT